jgi:Domain of unknown function (DUF4329)
MSTQRSTFEGEVHAVDPNWNRALNNLNALSMSEMLDTLAGLPPDLRKKVLSQAWHILSADRQWKGSYDRIDFAGEVVTDLRLGQGDTRAPPDQVETATNFLIARFKPAKSQALSIGFPTADAAAVAALKEILPTTNAVGLEFAGSIFSQGSSFRFTKPKRGEATSSEANVPIPGGTKLVAMYHTHPSINPNASNFSPQDIIICRGNATLKIPPRVSYLGTPAGKVKKLTPPDLLTGADKAKFGVFGKQVVLP